MKTMYFKEIFHHQELLEVNEALVLKQRMWWRGYKGERLKSMQCPGEGGAAQAAWFWEAGWNFDLDYVFPSCSTPSGSPSLNMYTHPYFWRVWKPAQFTLRSACVK